MIRNCLNSAILLLLPFAGVFPNAADADEIHAVLAHTNLKEEWRGYPCFLEIETVEGPEVTIQLSNSGEIWRLNFFVSDVADALKPFYKSNGLLDLDAFKSTMRHVEIGGTEFPVAESFLYEIMLADLDQDSSAMVSIQETHNVSRALSAMTRTNLTVPRVLSLSTTEVAFEDFRNCSFVAMGLEPDERVETDYRSELRRIFERAFVIWNENAARADACGHSRYDDRLVFEIIDEAGDAFYPGLLAWSKRNAFRSELESQASRSRASGLAGGLTNCLMAGQLAEISLSPVRGAIRSARDLE